MTTRHDRDARGFTLLEMAVVILLLGIIAAFSIPAFIKLNRSLTLKGTVSNLASQLQLSRQKAMATGQDQTVHLFQGTFGVDFHLHNGPVVSAHWKFPRGVSYLWSAGTLSGQMVVMTADGRADRTGFVILQMTPGGLRDSIYVQRSGMVIAQ